MITVTFHNQNEIPDKLLKFAVIAAKYDGKWIFCRHKERLTWEIPGGHRENGENVFDTAKRELYEETGAVDYDIKPVGVYGVAKDGNTTYGMLFFAEVKTLGTLPHEFEIGEIKLFFSIPEELTYPDIQPCLYRQAQEWLNVQSNPDDLWDVYDENRHITGRTHRRGDVMKAGDYHLVVHVWLQNSKGKFLITKRTPNKGFPNMWECTGGSAFTGDDSLSAAMREVHEETGLKVLPENSMRVINYRRRDSFVDVWLFRQDFNLKDVILQPNETCGAKYASENDIMKMKKEGKFVPFSYLEEFFVKVKSGI